MSFRHLICAALFAGAMPSFAMAQSASEPGKDLSIELNAIQDVSGSCRLIFLVTNETGSEVDSAVLETVIFDPEGGFVRLSLLNFGDLPSGRPRVRQFVVPDRTCAMVGQVLINGVSSCVIDGAESQLCGDALALSSRIDMELLG
ncbi:MULTISPECIES: hypothetical protein [unclassified Ruegeria]|uniref:hypothetical protein n=1 Tax=unclassified Ruegeria TaxID=2625375 RepID=UPI00148793D4|nr:MULTISPECIES: hypothetical protein [unclassified Ruegeria]